MDTLAGSADGTVRSESMRGGDSLGEASGFSVSDSSPAAKSPRCAVKHLALVEEIGAR